MHRKGFSKVPNYVWDDTRLDGTDIAFLAWFSSHIPGFIVKGPDARNRLGVSEPNYNKRMKKLVELGLISKKTAYLDGRVAGIYVQVFWPKLNKENVGSEGSDLNTEPTKTVRSNQGQLRRTFSKNRASTENPEQYGEVIDRQDDM